MTINVNYNGASHIFNCSKNELLDQISNHFDIDMRNVDIYAVKKGMRQKIQFHDICGVMKIEIVCKPQNGFSESDQR